jgi:glutamate synthase (NADPH) large chain
MKALGLYDPFFEHDSCGVGFVADIKGRQSHQIIEEGITILKNLEHRGAVGGDTKTGDGAGMLSQIPHEFFRKECEKSGIRLPSNGAYAVGMLFMPRKEADQKKIELHIEEALAGKNITGLGWREVPVCVDCLGDMARANMPVIKQIFMGLENVTDDSEELFERRLYRARKIIENRAASAGFSMILRAL